jgi:uncharacterized protein
MPHSSWRAPAAWLSMLVGSWGHATQPADCHIGTYRLADNSVLDVAGSAGKTLRWRRFDGTTGELHEEAHDAWRSTFGWTGRPDNQSLTFTNCQAGEISFSGLTGRRIAFDTTETTFHGRGVNLAGRLVLPRGNERVPIVVLIHGAEHDPAREIYFLQRLFPAEGVGAFVYDKRGTGASGGEYTQDFDVLADDAVAAMREARRLAGGRAGRTGYQGGSQAGWIVPLAATRLPVDFAIVSFGLAVSVIDEDQEEVALEMHLKGHNEAETTKALEVASAAEAVIASGFTSGFGRFDAVRSRYRDEPWYKDVHGNYTWILLPYNEAELREKGKDFNWHTPFYYDPMPTLRKVTTPQLWVLGQYDLEAPSAETSKRLLTLIRQGHDITVALYPGAEHGMTEFETAADGERQSTRYCADYFAMMRDFARDGRLHGTYGRSAITLPRSGHTN